MENINRRAIINYIRSEIETNATCETFAHVDWNCIRDTSRGSCQRYHQHCDAHNLVRTITERADGVFLWVALIMDALCRHLTMGCPVQVLRSYIDIFPNKLEEYFRTMIFKRIHETLISETAMALWIVLLDNSSLSYLALLCRSTESGVSWLMDADFCSTLPCLTCTAEELGTN